MDLFSFEQLKAYQFSRKLVVKTYKLIEKFPHEERYALASQLMRAIVSVPSNIAEGNGRKSFKEKIHFLEFAYGSLLESFCQLQLAADLGYISDEDLDVIRNSYFELSRIINGLSKSYESKLNDKKDSNQ